MTLEKAGQSHRLQGLWTPQRLGGEHFPTVCKSLHLDSQPCPTHMRFTHSHQPSRPQVNEDTGTVQGIPSPANFISIFGTVEAGIVTISFGQFKKLILKDVSPWI